MLSAFDPLVNRADILIDVPTVKYMELVLNDRFENPSMVPKYAAGEGT